MGESLKSPLDWFLKQTFKVFFSLLRVMQRLFLVDENKHFNKLLRFKLGFDWTMFDEFRPLSSDQSLKENHFFKRRRGEESPLLLLFYCSVVLAVIIL